MDDAIHNTAKQMNKIRFEYIRKNNKICEIINQETDQVSLDSSIFAPVVTQAVFDKAEENLLAIKQQGTGLIETFLHDFIVTEKAQLKDSVNLCRTRRFSKGVITMLESSFAANEYPSDQEKQVIANTCRITTKQVNNWFTNKRNRAKNIRYHD